MEPNARTPLLARLPPVPAVLTQRGMEKMSEQAPIDASITIGPEPPCMISNSEKHSRKRLPRAIAHRGYRAEYPENTMAAFAGAIEVGAHAIETDIHLSRDDVVVLSHDATLKRCFGLPDKISDCDWSHLSTLRTVHEPRSPMPRLLDLLEYLTKPGLEEIWILLDIKLDNPSDDVMRLIAHTIASVLPAPGGKPWSQRVVLGAWAAKYVPLAQQYLPGFPITHIGFSLSYARQFLSVPGVSFNMLLPVLMGPGGDKFVREVRRARRPLIAWTVNSAEKMGWCVRRGLDGVITDDPKLFLEVCKKHSDDEAEGTEGEKALSWICWFDVVRVWLFLALFSALYRRRLGRLDNPKVSVKYGDDA